MSILYSVDCNECKSSLIFHAPHRDKWICYKCGADLRPDWQKEEERQALLIKTAPNMYKALKHIVKCWSGNPKNAVSAIKEAIKTAKNAIVEFKN